MGAYRIVYRIGRKSLRGIYATFRGKKTTPDRASKIAAALSYQAAATYPDRAVPLPPRRSRFLKVDQTDSGACKPAPAYFDGALPPAISDVTLVHSCGLSTT